MIGTKGIQKKTICLLCTRMATYTDMRTPFVGAIFDSEIVFIYVGSREVGILQVVPGVQSRLNSARATLKPTGK